MRFTTPTVLVLTLKATEVSKSLLFLPGQYAAISFRSHGRLTSTRCFSLSSDPNSPDVVEFGIRVGGRFTSTLSKIKPGETVLLRGPFGGFVLDHDKQQSVVFLAGGIGITPFLSMIRHASSTPDGMAIKLLYSVRSQDEIAFRSELDTLAETTSSFDLRYVVSNGSTDSIPQDRSLTGYVTKEMLTPPLGYRLNQTTFFLCGPPPYMKAAIKNLEELGVSSDRIVTEAFSQGSGEGTRRPHGLQLNLYALSSLGFAAAVLVFLAKDIAKTLPAQLLPETVDAATMKREQNERQADLDALIKQYSQQANSDPASPGVTDARQAVTDAQTKLSQGQTTSSGSASGSYTAPSTPAAAPAAPASRTPVCTTSPSGVTTCI